MRAVRALLLTVAGVASSGHVACVGSLDDEERALFDVDLDPDGGGTDAGPDVGGPSCPDVVATLLASSTGPKGCAQAGCHSAASVSQGLDLESPDLVGRLSGVAGCSGVPYVDPDAPAQSLIVTKVGPGPYPCGNRMPFDPSGYLSDQEVSCVIAYLEAELAGPVPDAGVPDTGPEDSGVDDTGVEDTGVEPDMGVADTGAPPSTEFDVEAEAMSLAGGYTVFTDDPAASGGAYVTRNGGEINNAAGDPLSGLGGDPPRATIEFEMPGSTPVRVFGRVRAGSPDADSFWVRVNDGAWIRWNDISSASQGSWIWQAVLDADDNFEIVQFSARAGTNTLTIVTREPSARIDRVIVTQDPSFTPPP